MTTVSLTLEQENGAIETVSADFDPAELENLTHYVQYVDRVFDTSLLRRGIPSITNMNWSASDGQMNWVCPPYENAELHELLHVLRPLILSREATSFERIAGVLGRRFENETFRAYLRTQRTILRTGN